MGILWEYYGDIMGTTWGDGNSNLIFPPSGSRDSTMALWSISSLEDSSNGYLAEEVPTMEPIFKFSNISTETTEALALAGERVRSLAYNSCNYELASLQTSPCGASVYLWDAYVFQQVCIGKLMYIVSG